MTPKSSAGAGGDGAAERRKPAAFRIAGATVDPGSRRRLEIPLPRLTAGGELAMPVDVIHGSAKGPALWLSGAIHGDELDGVEIIRRVLEHLDPQTLAGTVVAAPIVNVFGVLTESRYLPDRRDLNRSFPGSARGSLAGRLAHRFLTEVVRPCAYGIDFHCGSDDRENLPHVRADLDDPETRDLALTFGAPVSVVGKPPSGSLRRAAVKEGARVLLYEAGEARRFTPEAIRTGVAGTLRVLGSLGMIDPRPPAEPGSLESRTTSWLRAGRSGICRLDVSLGERVKKHQAVGVITDVFGGETLRLRSRSAGIVIGRRIHPLVYQGEAVVHVAVC